MALYIVFIAIGWLIDINECEIGDHNCYNSTYCNDTTDSYSCSCPTGYELADDGHSCDGIDLLYNVHAYLYNYALNYQISMSVTLLMEAVPKYVPILMDHMCVPVNQISTLMRSICTTVQVN